jgi:Domain of unknown function (DUF397)
MGVKPGPHITFKWRKSSYSADQGNCIEIATQNAYVLVRDSNDHNGPMLEVASAQWENFLARIRK